MPESVFLTGVGVSHLKEIPTAVPVCLIWTSVYSAILLQCI